jgi:hypothetical protein
MASKAASEICIRSLGEVELETPLRWAAEEGWNPGTDDAGPFHAADPQGFLAACRAGEAVGSISVVRYGRDYGFLGLYIVKPAERGRGIGRRLWEQGMRHLERRVVGLDGVVEQQANYARSGFATAHRTVRHGGHLPVTEDRLDDRIREISPEDAGAVIAYDRHLFPAPRETFLRQWLDPKGRRGFAFVDGGRITGYSVIRRCREGYKIGPLFAEDYAVAEALVRAAARAAGGEVVFMDVPEPNILAARLMAEFGLSPVFETARMYRGPAPELPLGSIYGVTTLELG